MASQLDRIEKRVGQIAEAIPDMGAPPVPSKYDDSPPSSPSSTGSAETAVPSTPKGDIPDNLAQRFDDMQRLLGTLIGRTDDLANEVSRRRSFDIELSPRSDMGRLQDLLRGTLRRLGDDEVDEDFGRQPMHGLARQHDDFGPITPAGTDLTRDGSWFTGSQAVYSKEINPKVHAPAPSFTSEHQRRRNKTYSDVPESLLEGDLPEPDFEKTLQCRIYHLRLRPGSISYLMRMSRPISPIAKLDVGNSRPLLRFQRR